MSIIISHPVGPLQCNMTIIANPNTKEGVLVDPGGDFDLIKSLIDSNGLKIIQILITHAHLDHILASKDVADYTNAPVYYHPADRKLWVTLPFQCMIIGVP